MTTRTRPTIGFRRSRVATAAAIGALALALTLSACTGDPDPAPSLARYDPQPDFATVLDPAAFAPSPTSTTAKFAVDYSDDGVAYEKSQVLNAAQGGYFPMSNKRWFEDQMPQMSSMGLQHIRIDHVLNEIYYGVVSAAGDGTYTYDFSHLDERVLALVDQGFQPLLALSYTPAAFGLNPGDVPPMPEWTDAVTALVSHYRDLGFTGWDWEVWNEPDAGKWTGDQYNGMYAPTAAAVKAADPTARVGGATAAYLTSEGNISGQFIDFIGAHPEVPADFFSVHSYSSDNWDVVAASRQLLTNAGLDLPIMVTEWALHPSMEAGPGFGSDSNSSPTGAAYVARRLGLAADADVERVFYFAPVEGWTFSLPYNGDLGLITVDGHRKSIANVFAMYSTLGTTRVDLTATGEGTDNRNVSGFLTKDGENASATLLLWNNTAADVHADVDLTGLPYTDQNFRVTQKVISSTQGNGFSDTSTEVSPIYPSPNENAPIVSDVVHAAGAAFTEQIIIPAFGVVAVALDETDDEPGAAAIASEPSAINLASTSFGTVVASSSSIENPVAGWGLASATDGRRYSVDFGDTPMQGFSSQTHATDAAEESLTIDFGSSRALDSVSLWPYAPFMSTSLGFPVDAVIQASNDGAEWQDLATLDNYNDGAPVLGEQVFSFAATEARYVRVVTSRLAQVASEDAPAYALQLAEITAHRTGVYNGGFETGTLEGWTANGDARVIRGAAYSGNSGVELGTGSSVSTEIRGLRPKTSYTVGAYVRTTDPAGTVVLSVDRPTSKPVHTDAAPVPGWQHIWLSFTTAGNETFATITLTNESDDAVAWVDGATLMQVGATTE